MIKVRLLRIGAKKQPKYRIVIADEQAKRDGRFIEIVGRYDPTTSPPQVEIKKDRYSYWKSVGAQPTKTVTNLVKRYERTCRVPS
jgi:small subunit ribosomal protein S16